MSTKVMNGLLEYLYGTLSNADLRWMAQQMTEHVEKEEKESLRPYTMDEINAMIDEAEEGIARGEGYSTEEILRKLRDGENLEDEKELVEEEQLMAV